jgi:hypothetical protein
MSVELEVAREIRALRSLDLDRLSQALRKLPVPTKFVNRKGIPEGFHSYSEQELLDALFDVFERFPTEEDFGLWSSVAHAIEMFEEDKIRTGLVASIKRQPMWKTAELAVSYCTKEQLEGLLQYCNARSVHLASESKIDMEHIIHILKEGYQ